ncbi:MAG: hypothetical protein JWQ16_3386 [Novosphingobium sp.]|nr:hypothetical protein [Novosphingobium sp.]
MSVAPHTVVVALVSATNASSEIIGSCHGLYYHWRHLSETERLQSIRGAREAAEKLLVAILQAEQSIAPAPPASNVIAIGDHDPEFLRVVDITGREMGTQQ